MSCFVRSFSGTDGRFASCSHPLRRLSRRENGVTSVCPRIFLSQLYTSSGLSTSVGLAVNFPVPTVFNGKVYMGTLSEVDVFGPCAASSTGCLP